MRLLIWALWLVLLIGCNSTVLEHPVQVLVVGSGEVSGLPNGKLCRTDCMSRVPQGTRLDLLAKPDSGHVLVGYSGGCTSTTVACSVTVQGDMTVTVNFKPAVISLQVQGTEGGSVTSDPEGIVCTGKCNQTATFLKGTAVQLHAVPAAHHDFAGWQGDCSGVTTCSLTLNSNASVTAVFQKKTYPLVTSVVGHGRITGEGVDCATECTRQVTALQSLVLTAQPSAGHRLVKWEGGCSGSSPTCTVNMVGTVKVTAVFEEVPPQRHQVTVSVNAGGKILSSPPGISCPPTCSALFDAGQTLALEVILEPNHALLQWEGCPNSNGLRCEFKVDAARTVKVVLDSTVAVLTVPPSAGVQVTSNPAGLNCPPVCSATFPKGTQVALMGMPKWGYEVSEIRVDNGVFCLNSMSCAWTLTSDASAQFGLRALLDVQFTPGGIVEVNGQVCEATCVFMLSVGGQVKVKALPREGFLVDGWSNTCSADTCTFELTEPTPVQVDFKPSTAVLYPYLQQNEIWVQAGQIQRFTVWLLSGDGVIVNPTDITLTLESDLVGVGPDQLTFRYLPFSSSRKGLLFELDASRSTVDWRTTSDGVLRVKHGSSTQELPVTLHLLKGNP